MEPEQTPKPNSQNNTAAQPISSEESDVQAQEQKPHKSLQEVILTGIYISLLFIGVLVIVGLVLLFVVKPIKDRARKAEIAAQTKAAPALVAASRASAEKHGEDIIAQFDTAIKKAGIVTTDIASSKVDFCEISSSDSGFFATAYYQSCTLRYVRGYTTNLEESILKNSIWALKDTKEIFDPENEFTGSISTGCEFFSNQITKDTIGTTQLGLLSRPKETEATQRTCGIPDPTNNWSVTGLSNRSLKVFHTFDASKIDNSNNQFWVTLNYRYYQEALGCDVDDFICSTPRLRPIQAP